MRRASILGVLALALTLLSAAPALAAGPVINNLASPTHPDQYNGFYSNDPAFAWNVSPEIVGSCWSPTYPYDAAVAIDGHYAYLADFWQGLQVYDVSDPRTPVRIGGCDTPSQSWDVAVSGEYAYVADATAGLQIIALQGSEALTIVAAYDTPGECYGVRLIGDRAYVSDGSGGLVVLDVTDPLSPQLVGSCDTPGEAHDVAVNGQSAYVADGFGGLQIIALDGPAAWSVVGAYYTPAFAWGVVLSGTCAYVAAAEAGLQVIDVSDPGQPVLRGYCDTPGYSFIVEIAGDVAVVADDWAGVQFIDISDPASPTIVATSRLPGGANGLALHGDYVYAADASYGLQIVKLSTRFGYSYELDQDPTGVPGETVRGTAREADFTDVANGTWYFHVRAVALDAQGAPVGDWGPTMTYQVIVDHTPRIEDLFSPTHPSEWEWYGSNDPVFTWSGLRPLGSCWTGGNASCVAKAGDYAYLANTGYYTGASLQVVDVHDPAAPALVADALGPGSPFGVDVQGTVAYVALHDSPGLWLVDVVDPAAPQHVSFCPLPANANWVEVHGSLAYVADGDAGLAVVDVTTQGDPQLLGLCDTPGSAERVTLVGSLAYVGDGEGGLQIVDVSTPGDPRWVGAYDTPTWAAGVAVAGDYAYVCDSFSGLLVIDVSDPSQPTLVASSLVNEHCMHAEVEGSKLYVSGAYSGVHVLDISDPTAPVELARYFNEDGPEGLTVDGGLIYTAHLWGYPFQILQEVTDWAYSYILDQAPDTEPDETVDGAQSTASYLDVPDGEWWFHVRAVAVDAQGTPVGDWGPAVHRQVMIDATGPITAALSYKTAKRGSIWLRYSVTDDRFSWADVTIDITTAAGKLVHSMELGWRETNQTWSAVVDTKLAKGRYTFVVHAVDPVGVHESQTGRAYFIVR